MYRVPTGVKRTNTLFPYTKRCRSVGQGLEGFEADAGRPGGLHLPGGGGGPGRIADERCADGDRAGAGDGARADGLEQAAAVDGTALAGALFARVLFALSGHLMSSHVSIVDVFLIGTAPEYCAVYAVFVRDRKSTRLTSSH